MRYVGGKVRIAQWVHDCMLPAVAHCNSYLEPFVGGAAVFAMMRQHFAPERIVLADAHPDLILMWTAIRDGWEPPPSVTREDYERLRHEAPSALRGLVGFGASFGAKWFGGFVDRNENDVTRYPGYRTPPYYETARRAVAAMHKPLRGCAILHADYSQHNPSPGTLVYCDPPYANTTGYKGVAPFDSDAFWYTATGWARAGACVVVSEQAAPSPWICLATRERKAALKVVKGKENEVRTEKLFIHPL